MSWRVSNPFPLEDGSLDDLGAPTLMKGENYPRNRLSYEDWCMQPGAYMLHLYDNNLASASNASKGWDGGNLFFTTPSGCIIQEATIPYTDENAVAEITTNMQFLLIPEEGEVLWSLGPRGTVAVFMRQVQL